MSTTQNSRIISAPPEKVYEAFTSPDALAIWMAPGNMTGKIHNWDLRVGGGYEMSLFYPGSDAASQGKTSGKEDRYKARFKELVPPEKVVLAIDFDSADPAFAGEMLMEVTLTAVAAGTNVTLTFKNIPTGIRPEDNEAGTRSSLEKLAHYIAAGQ